MMREEARTVPPAARPEYERGVVDASNVGEIARKLSVTERVFNIGSVRITLILLTLAIIWEVYARWLDNALMFPTLSDTFAAMAKAIASGELLRRCTASLEVLVIGYAIGVVIAAALTSLAVATRLGSDILSTLTAMFNPLPAIALLPLALLWFGLGTPSMVFVLIHSVLWPVSLNAHSGFRSVTTTLRMAGQNYGLKGLRYVAKILIPAALPSILTGLKIGWAFAWRTLIASELVFGVSSGSGGLGWYIFENRNELQIDAVFAGLLTVILIGLFVESVVFRSIEKATVIKWGMER